jgi:hypothetical protein
MYPAQAISFSFGVNRSKVTYKKNFELYWHFPFVQVKYIWLARTVWMAIFPQNSYIANLTMKLMLLRSEGSRSDGFMDTETTWTWWVPFSKRLGKAIQSSCHRKTKLENNGGLKTRKWGLTDMDYSSVCILVFQVSKTVRITFVLLIRHTIYVILYSRLNRLRHQLVNEFKIFSYHFYDLKDTKEWYR